MKRTFVVALAAVMFTAASIHTASTSFAQTERELTLEQALEMAKKRNVLPINIALAYVLNQPFPTLALIGPRQLSETRTSLPALDIALTPDEVNWLNLES